MVSSFFMGRGLRFLNAWVNSSRGEGCHNSLGGWARSLWGFIHLGLFGSILSRWVISSSTFSQWSLYVPILGGSKWVFKVWHVGVQGLDIVISSNSARLGSSSFSAASAPPLACTWLSFKMGCGNPPHVFSQSGPWSCPRSPHLSLATSLVSSFCMYHASHPVAALVPPLQNFYRGPRAD